MKFTKIDDYVDKVAERYPTIPKKSIRRILEFGSRSFYMHTYYGCDILLKSNYYTLYCGRMFSSNIEFYKYRLIKKRIKYRFKYARKKPKYSRYYYLGLTEDEYKEYKKQLNSKTKRRQKITFNNVKLFKLLEETVLNRQYMHFFKIEIKDEKGFMIKESELTTRQYEYLGKRNGDQSIDYVSYEARTK